MATIIFMIAYEYPIISLPQLFHEKYLELASRSPGKCPLFFQTQCRGGNRAGEGIGFGVGAELWDAVAAGSFGAPHAHLACGRANF